MWRKPIPAEQAALDRPWRLWASAVVALFVAAAALLGFLVVPATERSGFDALAVICRAIGIPGYQSDEAEAPAGQGAAVQTVAWTADTRGALAAADPARGAALAAETCAACHGEAGVSVDPTMPSLAGQPAASLYKQLQDYRSGLRQSDIMAPFAQALDERQIADLSAFFAAQTRTAGVGAAGGVNPDIVALVVTGDPRRAIPPCASCHDAGDAGPIETPNLLRQRPDYLHQQLVAFASGARSNDVFGRMRAISAALTEFEMRRLADYYGGEPAR
jgi:cytochrome c553